MCSFDGVSIFANRRSQRYKTDKSGGSKILHVQDAIQPQTKQWTLDALSKIRLAPDAESTKCS
jgi:hypothetical protein